MGYRPKDVTIPKYIADQWEEMSFEERRKWLKWSYMELQKRRERNAFYLHEQSCECFLCRVFRERCRAKWVRDGKNKLIPKPPRWKQ